MKYQNNWENIVSLSRWITSGLHSSKTLSSLRSELIINGKDKKSNNSYLSNTS